MVGGVGDRSVTSSKKPIQPDGGNGCYPRVCREPLQAVSSGVKDGNRAHWLCSIMCGWKSAVDGPWFGLDRETSEQGDSLVTRRGGEGQRQIGRSTSVAMKGTGTELLRGNRWCWRRGHGSAVLSRFKGPERGWQLKGSVRITETKTG